MTKLPKFLEERRDELALKSVAKLTYKIAYNQAYQDTIAEVAPLLEALQEVCIHIDSCRLGSADRTLRKALADFKARMEI